jgi:hypothetical protein
MGILPTGSREVLVIRKVCALGIALSAASLLIIGCGSEDDVADCAACNKASYDCNGPGQTEAQAFKVKQKTATGCTGVYGFNEVPAEIRCEPLQFCRSGCSAATFENGKIVLGGGFECS